LSHCPCVVLCAILGGAGALRARCSAAAPLQIPRLALGAPLPGRGLVRKDALARAPRQYRRRARTARRTRFKLRAGSRASGVRLYKRLVHFEAYAHESTILLLPPPTCIARTIAILVHVYCAIYDAPPTPPLYAIHKTVLATAISCKGQRVPPGSIADERERRDALDSSSELVAETQVLALKKRLAPGDFPRHPKSVGPDNKKTV